MFWKIYLKVKIVENKLGIYGVLDKIDFGLRQIRETYAREMKKV